ncbi:MDH1B [Symbiodinium sp. CCMP2456]|nr:MDH1B [Symbiodinium sp. CCMP2456]
MAPALRAQACWPQKQAFHLAWCYERCHKAEQVEALTQLHEVAASLGSTLVCHKKALGFLSWLQSASGNVLLLTDWREAKPIFEGVEHLTEGGPQNFRVRMCITATSDRIHRRACEWANSIPQRGGWEVVVLDVFTRGGVEEFIVQSAGEARNFIDYEQGNLVRSPSPTYTDDVKHNTSHSPSKTSAGKLDLARGSASLCVRLSMATLKRALQDPDKATKLEEMIRSTMWHQHYED